MTTVPGLGYLGLGRSSAVSPVVAGYVGAARIACSERVNAEKLQH